jgi:hypothetical protein
LSLSSLLQSLLAKLPVVRSTVAERDQLRAALDSLKARVGFVPPGHFYSPFPDLAEIATNEKRIFTICSRTLPSLDLREAEQHKLLLQFASYYGDIPFAAEKVDGLRYYYENPAYSYSDAIMLHCMMRHCRPKRVVEIGSGFSSCVMLDTNEVFLAGSISFTFIEPYPDLLASLIKESDKSKVTIIPHALQEVELSIFDSLYRDDILFVDSTHVSKIDSDVNRVLFEILPRLRPGVYIHFHDIFYPFEYPKEWLYEGKAWNEAYAVRAFLQYNTAFRVVLMNTFMEHFREGFFQEHMPLCLRNRGGSLWLQKI